MKAENAHLPIQKCITGSAVSTLSDIELLAIIIGSGCRSKGVLDLAASLYHRFKGLRGIMEAGLRELARDPGIGMNKAVRLHASLEMGRRILDGGMERTELNAPSRVWRHVLPYLACSRQEEFIVLTLDAKNRLIRHSAISKGTLTQTVIHPREIFRDAIRESGCSIIMSHNHPSGVLTPSDEDRAATRRLAKAGDIIGIPLLDHVIVCETGYLSMKEEGYLR